MINLNNIEKKIQNFREDSDYSVRYENNGEKRIYTINPGKALEFIRQVVVNTPPPPFLSRLNIESNSIVEYRVEENNGIIIGQSFTVKTPSSGPDLGRNNPSIGNSDLWSSSIFGVGKQFNNQRALEFGQPNNQSLLATIPQSQFNNQQIGICYCNSTVEKTLPNDCNICLKCGGIFNDIGTEKAERRRKAHFDNIKREQEESFRMGQENQKKNRGKNESVNWRLVNFFFFCGNRWG